MSKLLTMKERTQMVQKILALNDLISKDLASYLDVFIRDELVNQLTYFDRKEKFLRTYQVLKGGKE